LREIILSIIIILYVFKDLTLIHINISVDSVSISLKAILVWHRHEALARENAKNIILHIETVASEMSASKHKEA
jgi:hypothetical protein